ncbi:glycoside hydrolase family 19 protein [Solilutibacter silvestris]|uniref:glycoside hydrolase family 19 protein n=1 Tax=Solilutibacter silvestris TaxID=1645665 RepID=UPI003D33B697
MYPTTDQLVALGASPANAARYSDALAESCIHYQITTAARAAAFLAQVFHESIRLQYARELWGPTPAQQRYEGRTDLGNKQPGDGFRFRGRGLIQITGRANYADMRDFLRQSIPDVPDFEAHPELLELPQWAAYSAAAFWARHGLNAVADSGDFNAVTRVINGGYNGMVDRQQLWAKAKTVLA